MTTDVIKRSVTRSDYDNPNGNGGILQVFIGASGAPGGAAGLAPWWSRARDITLSETPGIENMWASAVYKALTKKAARGWQIQDATDSQRRTKLAQDLLHSVDGAGWVPFLSRHLQDYLLTDNGAFVEVVRASRGAGSKIIGLVHLDSLRCTRTGDIATPVLYRDDGGAEHGLRADQVLMFADMASPRASYKGVGRCAASRAWDTIIKLASVETYFREKVSGSRNLAIHLISGVTRKQLEEALATGEAARLAKGHLVYNGALLIPGLDTSVNNVGVTTIPLAEIPDGFDIEQERRDAYLRYANALGVAVQDIQPLSGQGLGTGTQTIVLDEAADGQGLAGWDKQWEQAISFRVLPSSTTFAFATNDIRDQKATAEVEGARAATRAARIASGEITAVEARQLALDSGDLPAEMMTAIDATPGGSLYDDEKAPTVEVVKAVDDLFLAELAAAAALMEVLDAD